MTAPSTLFLTELELIEAMQAADLWPVLDQDVRDLCRLIQEYAKHPNFPNLRIELLQSLNRLVQAAKTVGVADDMVDLFLSEAERAPLPIGIDTLQREEWTDWITMVLKNCGAWKVARHNR